MGRVFAWKFKYIDSDDPSSWETGYSWLSKTGPWWAEGTPSEDVLDGAMAYAGELGDFETYKVAFNRMLSHIPKKFLCTNRLKSPEEYFYDACEWGGGYGYCGADPSQASLSITTSCELDENECCVCQDDGGGCTFLFQVNAIKVKGLKVYYDGTNDITTGANLIQKTELEPRGTNRWAYLYKIFVQTNDLTIHTIKATANGVEDQQRCFHALAPQTAVFSFSPPSRTVGSTTTSSQTTLTKTDNVTVTTAYTLSNDCTLSVNGNNYTLTFPENCDNNKSVKTYACVAEGISGTTGGHCETTFTVTQYPCEETCSPSIQFTTQSPVTKASSETSAVLYFTYDCCDSFKVNSSNPEIFVPALNANQGTVTVTFPKNEIDDQTTTERSCQITITGEKTGKQPQTSTISIVQNGHTVPPPDPDIPEGEIKISSGPESVSLTGGEFKYIVTTKYALLTGATISPESIGEIKTIDAGSTGAEVLNGEGSVTILVSNFKSDDSFGEGNMTLSLSKGNYQGKDLKFTCTDGGSSDVCLSPDSRTFTLTVSGVDHYGNLKTDSITITQQ